MDGRKIQRKKLPVRNGNFGLGSVFDRKEQHKEDYVDWEIFLTQTSRVSDLEKTCFILRQTLKLPPLKPQKDLLGVIKSGYGPFTPKGLYLGVASNFLYDNPEAEEELHKLIRNSILIPEGWSYNFYPVIEYFVLYRELPKDVIFFANPCLFELFKAKPHELLRANISTSDIRFLRERLRIHFVSGKKATKEQAKLLEKYNAVVDTLAKEKKHLPKNVAFKICAFRIFRDMEGSYSRLYYSDEVDLKVDDDSRRFLKNQIKDFKIQFKRFQKAGIAKSGNPTEKTIHNALKKLHLEYLELSTK